MPPALTLDPGWDALGSATMPPYETLTLDRPRDEIAVATLNRPSRLNALSPQMFDELHELCGELARADPARVLVVTGAGRAFCSGFDLDEAARLPEMTTPEVATEQEYWGSLVAKLRALPQPVIAAVNGPATGGGLSLALAADIRIAASDARFNAAFVKIGLSSGDLGVSWALPRVVGLGIAAELMYTGRFVDAQEAARIGLANRVVEPEDLLDAALGLAEEITANSPYGVRLSKRSLQANVDAASVEAALEYENRGQALATRTRDMPEALRAFRERRSPEFEDR